MFPNLKCYRFLNLIFGTVPLTVLGFAPTIFQVKAGLRTLIPMEQKYIEEEPKVSKQVLHHLYEHIILIYCMLNTACLSQVKPTSLGKKKQQQKKHNHCLSKIHTDD